MVKVWEKMNTINVDEFQIPKPNSEEGLGIEWPAKETDMEKLKALHSEIKAKMWGILEQDSFLCYAEKNDALNEY